MDPHTGLADMSELSAWLEEHAHEEKAVLALLDLDGTAALNDLHGHETVDELLARLASLIRARCGAREIAARAGGEEFALGLLEDELDEVMTEIERIRLHFRAASDGATLSVGICDAETLRHSPMKLTLFQAAENALDEAKRQGPEGLSVYH
jgi:diguanylate cyclase (GGDEF)-like protein